jgi:hypothetical protein
MSSEVDIERAVTPVVAELQSYLQWVDQLALQLTNTFFRAHVPPPLVRYARMHYKSKDGLPLTSQEATQLHTVCQRRGTELIETVLLQHRLVLHSFELPTYCGLDEWYRKGWLMQDGWLLTASQRHAHNDIIRAVRWSSMALLQNTQRMETVIPDLSSIQITTYESYHRLMLVADVMYRDEQLQDIVQRTELPHNYIYIFAYILIHTRMTCVKTLELLVEE